jgi:hypothetical protein
MQISIKNLVSPSIPQIALLTICCMAIWGLSLYETPHIASGTDSPSISNGIQAFTKNYSLFSQFIILAIVIFNTFLVSQLNTRFTIIRTRTYLPVFIFLLISASWFEKQTLDESHILLTLGNLSLFYFLRMVRNRNSSEEAFMGSFILACGSLLVNPFVLLIPVCWMGFMIFQSFSFRTFLASVLGTLAPWILYLTAQLSIKGDIDFHDIINIKPVFSIDIFHSSIPTLIYAGGLLIIMSMGLIGLSSLTISDSIQTKNKLNFLILLLFSISILGLLFQDQLKLFLPLLALCYSILIAHPFTLKLNNFYGILFIVFVVWNIGFVLSKLIIQ